MRSEVVSEATEAADPVREVQEPVLGQTTARKGPTLTEKDIARFWAKVDRNGGPDACWPWKGARTDRGYGHFRRYGNGSQPVLATHRVAFILHAGSIPAGLFVCHCCDNPPCCNPAHLFAGTHQDNVDDMVNKGRTAMGNRSGSRLHPERLIRGMTHHNAKLTDTDVRAIRAQYPVSGWTMKALGASYGVNATVIWKILHREIWIHVV